MGLDVGVVTRQRLAERLGPLMRSDRFRYDQAAREDVLVLVAVGKALGDRDVSGLSDEELDRVIAEFL